MDALFEVAVQVVHPAGAAGAQPRLEVLDVPGCNGRSIRNPHGVKAQRQGLILYLLFQTHGNHYTTAGS
jgi:hypothetical protein